MLAAKRERDEVSTVPAASKAVTTTGCAYVNRPRRLLMGVANAMLMGAPSSTTARCPDAGGNSNSFSETPAVSTAACEKVSPGNCVLTETPSISDSKSNPVGASARTRPTASAAVIIQIQAFTIRPPGANELLGVFAQPS